MESLPTVTIDLMASQKVDTVYIDFEQVFDIWSLVFCIARQHRQLKNSDYSKICNFSVEQALSNIFEKDAQKVKELKSAVEGMNNTTKPWIPYIQFINHVLAQEGEIEVCLRYTIEENLVEELKLVHITSLFCTDRVKVMPKTEADEQAL